MRTLTATQAAIVAADVKADVSWLFEIDRTGNGSVDDYFSTKAKTWNGQAYTFKVKKFDDISLQRNRSESGLQAPSRFSFTLSNKGTTLRAADFSGGKVTVRLVAKALTGTSQYPTQDDAHVKATTKLNTSHWPYYATDPAKSVTGDSTGNAWASLNEPANQRLHIDVGSAKIISRVYYENLHGTGMITDYGVKNFTLWGRNSAASFAELTYGTDTGWATQLTTDVSQFARHTAADSADPKYITVMNTTGYRYYAFKFADNWGGPLMGLRRIELQETEAELASWNFDITSVSGDYQELRIECRDWLTKYLEGTYPKTPDLRYNTLWGHSVNGKWTDEYFSRAVNKICIPLIFGKVTIPIYPVEFTESGVRYLFYVLGKKLADPYDFYKMISPDGIAPQVTWEPGAGTGQFTTTHVDVTGTDGVTYEAIIVKAVDSDADTVLDTNPSYKSGDNYLPMYIQYQKHSDLDLTSPADILEYILEDMGVPSAMLDATTLATLKTTCTTRGISWNFGLYQPVDRKKLLSDLLVQCDCELILRDKIYFKVHSKTSVASVDSDKVLSGSFKTSASTPTQSDSGYVQHKCYPPKLMPGAATYTVTQITSGVCTCASTGDIVANDFVRFGAGGSTANKIYQVTTVTTDVSFTLNDLTITDATDVTCQRVSANESPDTNLFRSLVTAKGTTDTPTTGQDIPGWAVTLTGPGGDVDTAAKIFGTLALQRILNKVGEVSFAAKGKLIALEQDDVITILSDQYGAGVGNTFDVLIDSITISKDLSLRITASRFSPALSDYADVSPATLTISGGEIYQSYQPVVSGPDKVATDGAYVGNTLPGRLRVGSLANHIIIDPDGPYQDIMVGAARKLRIGNLNTTYGILADSFGIGIGADDLSGNYLRYDATSGKLVTNGMITGSYIYGSSLMTKGTYLAASCLAAAATITVGDTTDFPASGSASFIDSANDRDSFTYTGKTATTLTGCSGVLAHTVSATNKPLVVPAVKGMYINDAVNEMRFFDDRGDGVIEELAGIGINGVGSDWVIGKFGSLTSSRTALYAESSYFTIQATTRQSALASFGTAITGSAFPITSLNPGPSSCIGGSFSALRGTNAGDTGTVLGLIALNILYGNYSASVASTTSSAMGIYIIPYHKGGVITSSYGIYIDSAATGITPTNYYGIYQEDPAAKNFFAGNIEIGDGKYFGLGAAKGRIQFDDEATDTISLLDCNVGIGTAAGLAKLSVNGGVHVGGDSDPGDNNLLVDGTAEATKFLGPEVKTDTSTATDLTITCGSGKTLVLGTAVYKDENVGALVLQTGGTLPGIVEIKNDAGGNTGIYTRGFAVGEQGSGCIEVPHDYKEGTNIVFHVHWGANDAPSGTDYVRWQLVYSVQRDEYTFRSATTVTTADQEYGVQYAWTRTDVATITGSTGGIDGGNIKVGDQIHFTISRVAASGDAYAGEMLAATIGIHYQVDTMGSRAIGTK